jgi:PAS domain S-box-containing protein
MSTSNIVILNVDDNDGARYARSRVLQNAGYQVAEVANGTDALAFVKETKPDLVLLDVSLPDINGIEVCRRIKSQPSSASVLVLQTSAALTGVQDRIKGLEGGADNYLVAPIEPDELLANVRAMLRLRNTQAELRESEERFRQLAENIDDVFWVLKSSSEILYISPAYEHIWQRRLSDLLSSPDDWLSGVHIEDRERIRDGFKQILESQEYDEEYRVLQQDGTVKWVRDRAYALKNNDHEPYRIVRITHDISSKKNAEQVLRDADKNKNVFLATLAHELRNPLAPIRNAIAVMQRGNDSSVELQKKAQEVIIRQTGHLTHLVDDLLDIIRISQGKIVLRKTRINLQQVLEIAVEAAAPILETRQHAFGLSIPDEEIWLEADSVRISQCVSNLLNNSAKFTPVGGKIELKAELNDSAVRITVNDNGIGISADRISQIFGLFMQGEISADYIQDGLGIGLSLTKRLIELHDGKISVRSEGEGRGSSFVIELPYDDHSRGSTVLELGTPTTKRIEKNFNILVVDDNEDSREMMAALLSMEGHTIFQAKDAATTFAAITENRFDFIISDIGLPGLDGYHIARTLRSMPELNALRLIALTGFGAPDDQRKAREAGFDWHLVKPVDIDKLVSVLYDL